MKENSSIKKCIFFLLLLIFVGGFLVLPKISIAKEITIEDLIKDSERIQLGEEEGKCIFVSLIKELDNKWETIVVSGEDMILEKEIVLKLVKRAVQEDLYNYLFLQVPKNIGKEIIKAGAKIVAIIWGGDPSTISEKAIEEIEKLTVEKAKEYVMKWLLQNQIKVMGGNLSVSYQSIKADFQDIIVYKPIDTEKVRVGINVYSSRSIKIPHPTVGFQWEGGIEELPPFMLEIDGVIERDKYGAYNWVEGPEMNFVFDQKVPEFSFKEPSFWDRLKASIKSIFSDLNPFKATVNPFSEDNFQIDTDTNTEESDKKEDLSKESSSEEDFGREEEKQEENQSEDKNQPKEESSSEDEINKKQEQIDDILERIDILRGRIDELGQEEEEEFEKNKEEDNQEEDDKEKDEEEEEEDEDDEEGKEEKGGGEGGGGGGAPEPNYCDILDGQAARDKVIINEVAWMGTDDSSNDEWLEFKNISDGAININEWQLLDKDGQIKAILSAGTIKSGEFYLLERTDDTSVPGVSADFIYTGGLSNTDEALYLFDSSCQLQDKVKASPDWPAGENEEKKTMERGKDLEWHTYSGEGEDGIMGTPRAENSQPLGEEEPLTDTTPPEVSFGPLESVQTSLSFTIPFEIIDKATDTVTPSGLDRFIFRWEEENGDWQEDDYQEIEEAPVTYSGEREFSGKDGKIYYFQIKAKDIADNESDWLPQTPASTTISISQKILISEVQIAGDESSYDFIELYNPNDNDLDISNFKLRKKTSSGGESSVRVFPEESIIEKKNYFLWANSSEDFHLSVGADAWSTATLAEDNSIAFLSPEEIIIDALAWGGGHTNPFVETAPFPENPDKNQSLGRKWDSEKEEYQDTDDNSVDFEIQIPTPKAENQSSPPLPSYSEVPWPMFQHDAQHTGRSPFVGPGFSDNLEITVLVEGDYFGPIAIDSSGILYFEAGIKGNEGVYAFYPDGLQKWFFPNPTSLYNSPIIGPDGAIYLLGDKNKSVLALNPDGTLKWEKVFKDITPSAQAAIKDNRIYFLGSGSPSKLTALDLDNGNIVWQYEIQGYLGGSPTIAKDGTIYFGYNDILYAINSDGTEKWQRKFEPDCDKTEYGSRCDYSPSIEAITVSDDGAIYVVVGGETYKHKDGITVPCLHALSPDNPLKDEWVKKYVIGENYPWIQSPAIGPSGNVYLGSWTSYWGIAPAHSRLVAFRSNGSEIFEKELGNGGYGLCLVDSEENLYVLSIGGGSSKLHIFNEIGEQKIVDFTFLSENGFLSLGGQNDLYIPGRENLYVVKPSVGDGPLIEGCIDSEALNLNYNPEAEVNDDSCIISEVQQETEGVEDIKLKGDTSASSTATSTLLSSSSTLELEVSASASSTKEKGEKISASSTISATSTSP